MKNILTFGLLLFSLSSCFKDVPSNEFLKVGGSWKIEEVIIESYDSLGNQINQKEFKDRGYIMLNFNDGSLADNSFSYSLNNDDAEFNAQSRISRSIGLSNRWDVSVEAKHINFGFIDLNTNFSTLIVVLTIDKLKSNKMHWFEIERNNNGSLARRETYKLKRAN